MAYKKILLLGEGRRLEHEAGASLTPGRLVEYNSDEELILHSNDGGDLGAGNRVDVVLENELSGDEIGDAYAEGDRVQHAVLSPGDEFLGWLKDEENVAFGAVLCSDGAGGLRAATAGTDEVIAIAKEALNLTGASGDARIIAEKV